eukprot:TRINITY_DN34144_c0_g1_i1.p1 TRINITY_DN34144_c0_g1~~TRINITY_DN34144_c0_g1_i1.p1  ORF type:complete len:1104 (-),score=206.41 TRINITY_DN34144_c0_g1_i1:95-3406(-)
MSMSMVSDEFAAKAWEFVMLLRLEICLFLGAVFTYFALFGNSVPRNSKLEQRTKASSRRLKSAANNSADNFDEWPEEDTSAVTSEKSCNDIELAFEASFESGDFSAAYRHWCSMKNFLKVPNVALPHVVEAMQRIKMDTPNIVHNLKSFLKRYSQQIDAVRMHGLLESLSRRMDSDLVNRVVELLPQAGLRTDSKTYEIIVSMHFASRNFQEVTNVVAEMRAKSVPLTTRTMIVLIKTALKQHNFEEACFCFREIKPALIGPTGQASSSTAPRLIVSQLVELACKEHQLQALLNDISDVPLTEEAVNAMLNECAWQRDASLVTKVEKLARDQGLTFSDRTYSLLLKCACSNPAHGTEVLDEVLQRESTIPPDLAIAALAVCSCNGDVERADILRKNLKSTPLSVLASFLRFYAENNQCEKACDIYERDMARDGDGTSEVHRPVTLDPRLERVLMSAALRCGRSALAQNLLANSPSDVAKHIAMVRNCALNGNLAGAIKVFETLKRSGTELNSIVYNTVLDACVECRNLAAAEEWMKTIQDAGMADIVTYNTLIKAHLQGGNYQKALEIVEDIKKAGLQPNRVTFNELVNFMVNTTDNALNGAKRAHIWSLVGEMHDAGVKPNQVTCSILLKGLNSNSKESDIHRTMDLINDMEEQMDEVLLSSVVEACVRVGKPDLLSSKLKQFQDGTHAVNGSHTFGSLIKAYGHARDIDGVWRCWKEMRSRHIRPTSITLGCMVEAVVSNGDTEGAYEIIHQVQSDERCRDALNSVIYCSVLKGFAREKKVDRVWSLYEEMSAANVELSVVTYNTMIDACARSGQMDRVPGVLQDMARGGVKPNVITYSTMLKGHCQQGNIHAGFKLLDEMKHDERIRPDEIAYNSLLDGCAQNGLVDEGLGVLAAMEEQGVPPSNFTLSVLVKLMSRARRLDEAFTLVEELTAKYHFSPNVHVYTNLAQACVSNRALGKAMNIFEKIIEMGLQPIARTYTILIRAYLQRNDHAQASRLLRGALGIPRSLPFIESKANAKPTSFDDAVVNETLSALADNPEVARGLLADIRQYVPRVRIDSSTQRRLMEGCHDRKSPAPARGPTRGGRGRGMPFDGTRSRA